MSVHFEDARDQDSELCADLYPGASERLNPAYFYWAGSRLKDHALIKGTGMEEGDYVKLAFLQDQQRGDFHPIMLGFAPIVLGRPGATIKWEHSVDNRNVSSVFLVSHNDGAHYRIRWHTPSGGDSSCSWVVEKSSQKDELGFKDLGKVSKSEGAILTYLGSKPLKEAFKRCNLVVQISDLPELSHGVVWVPLSIKGDLCNKLDNLRSAAKNGSLSPEDQQQLSDVSELLAAMHFKWKPSSVLKSINRGYHLPNNGGAKNGSSPFSSLGESGRGPTAFGNIAREIYHKWSKTMGEVPARLMLEACLDFGVFSFTPTTLDGYWRAVAQIYDKEKQEPPCSLEGCINAIEDGMCFSPLGALRTVKNIVADLDISELRIAKKERIRLMNCSNQLNILVENCNISEESIESLVAVTSQSESSQITRRRFVGVGVAGLGVLSSVLFGIQCNQARESELAFQEELEAYKGDIEKLLKDAFNGRPFLKFSFIIPSSWDAGLKDPQFLKKWLPSISVGEVVPAQESLQAAKLIKTEIEAAINGYDAGVKSVESKKNILRESTKAIGPLDTVSFPDGFSIAEMDKALNNLEILNRITGSDEPEVSLALQERLLDKVSAETNVKKVALDRSNCKLRLSLVNPRVDRDETYLARADVSFIFESGSWSESVRYDFKMQSRSVMELVSSNQNFDLPIDVIRRGFSIRVIGHHKVIDPNYDPNEFVTRLPDETIASVSSSQIESVLERCKKTPLSAGIGLVQVSDRVFDYQGKNAIGNPTIHGDLLTGVRVELIPSYSERIEKLVH